MAKNVIAINADTAQAVKAVTELADKIGGIDKALELLLKFAAQAGDGVEKMGGQARRVFNETRTAAERYELQVAKLTRMLDAGKITQDTYNRALEQAKQRLDEAGRAAERAKNASLQAFGEGAVSGVKTLIGALGIGTGLAGAIDLVKREYESLIETQKRARDTTLTEAAAQRNALINLGASNVGERDSAIGKISQMSAETGVSMADLYSRVATAASAKGSLTNEQAMEAVRVSAEMLPGDPAGGTTAAGAILDMMKNQGGSARGNMGQLLALQRMARVTDMGKVAESLPSVLLAGTAKGMPVSQTGSIWAAITNAIGDTSGQVSGTATIKMLGELDRLFPEKSTYKEVEDETAKRHLRAQVAPERARLENRLRDATLSDSEYTAGILGIEQQEKKLRTTGRRARPEDEIKRQQLAADRDELTQRVHARLLESTGIGAQITALDDMVANVPKTRVVDRKGTGAKTAADKLAYLHASSQAQEEFMGTAGTELENYFVAMKFGREKAKEAVKQIISGKGTAYESYRKFSAEVPTLQQAEQSYAGNVAMLGGTDIAQTSKFSRVLKAGSERLRTKNQEGARRAIAREYLDEMLRDTGMSDLGARFSSLSYELGTDKALPGLIGEIETRKRALENPSYAVPNVVGPGGGAMPARVEPTDVQRKQAETLGEVLAVLKELVAEQRQSHQSRGRTPTLARPNEDK